MRLFVSHDWGSDGRNHERVGKVVKALRSIGHSVWFDETDMKGNLMDAMCNGIDHSDAVLVFVTRRYVEKVASGDDTDNCRREFMYAQSKHAKHSRMIALRFDATLPSRWTGPVGMVLGERLYVDMATGDPASPARLAALAKSLPVRSSSDPCKALERKGAARPVMILPNVPDVVGHGFACEMGARQRVLRLVKKAGITDRVEERTHEKLERVLASLGLAQGLAGAPLPVKIEQAERQLCIA